MTRLTSSSPTEFFVYSVEDQSVVVNSQETKESAPCWMGSFAERVPRLTSFAFGITLKEDGKQSFEDPSH